MVAITFLTVYSEIDLVIFSDWKAHEGWFGDGVGGELTVTKEPGVTSLPLRVDTSGRIASKLIGLSG